MPPNARHPEFLLEETTAQLQSDDVEIISRLLDEQADTKGLTSVNEGEDWTDVKHSERKKRDRILDDGVLIGLMKKSDAEGFRRLGINLSIMVVTAMAIGTFQVHANASFLTKLAFLPLYVFYGFQFQCFAFAGQHEFAHRNAFKTKWINDVCLFLVSVFCFEMGAHEKVMHKQHHTFTNNIDRVSSSTHARQLPM